MSDVICQMQRTTNATPPCRAASTLHRAATDGVQERHAQQRMCSSTTMATATSSVI